MSHGQLCIQLCDRGGELCLPRSQVLVVLLHLQEHRLGSLQLLLRTFFRSVQRLRVALFQGGYFFLGVDAELLQFFG